MSTPIVRTVFGVGLLLAGALAGCAPLRSHQGYVIDADLVNSVQPGVDNRSSVQQVLGKPTLVGQFGSGEWYYLARDSRNYGFQVPHPRTQTTIAISFDQAGTVTAIRRGSEAQVASISPYGKTTPTLGRQRGFFQDLFGNIGTVGAAGGNPNNNGGVGGGRDTP